MAGRFGRVFEAAVELIAGAGTVVELVSASGEEPAAARGRDSGRDGA